VVNSTRALRWAAGLLAAGCVALAGCTRAPDACDARDVPEALAALLPDPDAWIGAGLALDTGPFGSWDTIMEGITPAAVQRRHGAFLLYYVGARDYITALDNVGPADRAIGVATSPDGINWTKVRENPVITFSSSGNPEEGAVSLGVTVADEEVLAFYGANIALTSVTPEVNADIRLAASLDGVSFTDRGTVVRHHDRSVWGAGDEIHPTLAARAWGLFHVFYVPNGTPQREQLGMCSGTSASSLSGCRAVVRADGPVPSRGPSSAVPIGSDALAVFVSTRGGVDAYVVDDSDLSCFGAPLRRYASTGGAVFMLDAARRTWFAYEDAWTHIEVKVAPAGPRDATPPSAPASLESNSPRHDRVGLTWSAAADEETGILEYRVYRDGTPVGRTRSAEFIDEGLRERTIYAYEVRAVNLHGLEGAGVTGSARTAADAVPPVITAVSATAPSGLVVTFDEPVAPDAGDPRRFRVSGGVRVLSAAATDDPRVVRLTTSPMRADAIYTVSAEVGDRAARPNRGSSTKTFTASPIEGLVGYWRLEAPESLGRDTSGWGNHAIVHGSPLTIAGRVLGAAELRGREYLEIPPSVSLDDAAFAAMTVAAWVRPARLPPATTSVDKAYTVFSGPGGLSLKYRSDGRFVGTLETAAGPATVSSGVIAPGAWHHVALVIDGDRRVASLFVNGEATPGSPGGYPGERARVPLRSPNHEAYRSAYRLGVTSPSFAYESDFFEGQLDEVRVYRRALKGEEVRTLAATE
jgi:hypothetical protein